MALRGLGVHFVSRLDPSGPKTGQEAGQKRRRERKERRLLMGSPSSSDCGCQRAARRALSGVVDGGGVDPLGRIAVHVGGG